MTQPRIYMAGPDVFMRDYAQHKAHIRQWCDALGLVALCPGDDDIKGESKAEVARRIYEVNIALIDSADYVVANVRDFRGHEPDSGTVFEIGYAVGRGKKVWCYNTPTQDLLHQIPQGEPGYCGEGMHIEDFGLPRNLMLAGACTLVSADLHTCLQQVARWHAGQR